MPFAWLLAVHLLLLSPQAPKPACDDVASCKAAALEAAARQDYEAFHDLAWLAVRKGKPNDPELMYLLARAQSLSGRPGDALVMLRRIAERGVATDARENDDFRRVRALEGWPEVEAMIAAVAARSATPVADADRDAAPAPVTSPPAVPDKPARAAVEPKSPPPSDAVEPAPAARPTPAAPTVPEPIAADPAPVGEEALALSEAPLDPIGLAYDDASRRFVLGDRSANKLIVADDVFKRTSDLIGAESAGFGTLTAVAIDRRRGDLWVASSGDAGAASVHKLQLVSGRVLSTFAAPDDMRPAAFSDLVVTDAGSVLALDSAGSRLIALGNGSGTFSHVVPLDLRTPASLASVNGLTYVAHEDGLSIVDPHSGNVSPVKTGNRADLRGLRRIRADRGALLAIQSESESAAGRLVRIRLSRNGRTATAVEPLDRPLASAGSALTISRDAAYYIASTDHGPVIRRVPLR